MSMDVLEVGGRKFEGSARTAMDLKPVLAFPQSLEEDFDAYYMFRDVYYSRQDKERITERKLRYDITVIPPNSVGGEYIKTYGHYHPEVEKGLSYTEIYEVLEGTALYLLQKEENGEVTDVIIVEASSGDKVIIPPNYGHVTINPSNKLLKMANWVHRGFSSEYRSFEKKKGACYYFTHDGWIKNEMYSDPPTLNFVQPNPNALGLKRSEEMYKLVKDLDKLEFLWKPSKHEQLFGEAFKEK
ncbi:MAG: glucose-6-phosphate isomerase family protein [Archaeoglobaceae archaeon]